MGRVQTPHLEPPGPLYEQSLAQVGMKTARVLTILQFRDAISKAKKADSLEQLAAIMGMDQETFRATVERYNAHVETRKVDEFGKSPDKMQALLTPPFYALDLSPRGGGITPVITLGGLQVNEETGQVLRENGSSIEGLYAAGRTAVGLPSNNYVTGLSVADCIFSGRRAGQHAALS